MGKSGRGGAREHGGRPSPWKNGPTKTIRIPEIFAEAVLDVVKKLDSGCREIIVVDPKSLFVNQPVKKNQVSSTPPRKYVHAGHKVLRVKEVIQFLENYLESD